MSSYAYISGWSCSFLTWICSLELYDTGLLSVSSHLLWAGCHVFFFFYPFLSSLFFMDNPFSLQKLMIIFYGLLNLLLEMISLAGRGEDEVTL